MRFLVVAAVLVASVAADVSHIVNKERDDQLRSNQVYQPIPILSQAMENNGFGNYKFNYETGNGIQVNEESELKNVGTQNEAEAAHGSYSYVGDDGVTYTVNWIADEYGFRASGAHIPEAIQQSLQQLPQGVQAQAPARSQQSADRFVQLQERTSVRAKPAPVRAQQFVQVQQPAKQLVQVQAAQVQQVSSRFVQQPVRAQQFQVQQPAQLPSSPRFVQELKPVQPQQFVQVQKPALQPSSPRFVQDLRPAGPQQFGQVQQPALQPSSPRFVQELKSVGPKQFGQVQQPALQPSSPRFVQELKSVGPKQFGQVQQPALQPSSPRFVQELKSVGPKQFGQVQQPALQPSSPRFVQELKSVGPKQFGQVQQPALQPSSPRFVQELKSVGPQQSSQVQQPDQELTSPFVLIPGQQITTRFVKPLARTAQITSTFVPQESAPVKEQQFINRFVPDASASQRRP